MRVQGRTATAAALIAVWALGAGTMFAGNIIADQSITLNTGASILCGRAIALNGAVTMDGNAISNNCTGQGFGSGLTDSDSSGVRGISAVPEPSSLLLCLAGLAALAGGRARKKAK